MNPQTDLPSDISSAIICMDMPMVFDIPNVNRILTLDERKWICRMTISKEMYVRVVSMLKKYYTKMHKLLDEICAEDERILSYGMDTDKLRELADDISCSIRVNIHTGNTCNINDLDIDVILKLLDIVNDHKTTVLALNVSSTYNWNLCYDHKSVSAYNRMMRTLIIVNARLGNPPINYSLRVMDLCNERVCKNTRKNTYKIMCK